MLVLGPELDPVIAQLHISSIQEIPACDRRRKLLDRAPYCGVTPILIDIKELFLEGTVRFEVPSLGLSPGLSKQRRDTGGLIIQPASHTGVGLVFNGGFEIGGKGSKCGLIRCFAAVRVPALDGNHSLRQRVLHDIVLDRAEQHLSDRNDEGQKHKGQQGQDQGHRPHFLPPECPVQAVLERPAIGGKYGT